MEDRDLSSLRVSVVLGSPQRANTVPGDGEEINALVAQFVSSITEFCPSFPSKFCAQLEVGLLATEGGECILALAVSHFYNPGECFLQVICQPPQSHIWIAVGLLSPNLVHCVFFFKSLKISYRSCWERMSIRRQQSS